MAAAWAVVAMVKVWGWRCPAALPPAPRPHARAQAPAPAALAEPRRLRRRVDRLTSAPLRPPPPPSRQPVGQLHHRPSLAAAAAASLPPAAHIHPRRSRRSGRCIADSTTSQQPRPLALLCPCARVAAQLCCACCQGQETMPTCNSTLSTPARRAARRATSSLVTKRPIDATGPRPAVSPPTAPRGRAAPPTKGAMLLVNGKLATTPSRDELNTRTGICR